MLRKVMLVAAKRAHLVPSDYIEDWWVGYGKDESCQFEGCWLDMAILAAQILKHENTQLVALNLYKPDLEFTEEQRRNYTSKSYQPNEWMANKEAE